MKKCALSAIFVCCITVLFVSSCNNDAPDIPSVPDAEKAAAAAAIRGYYEGKMICESANSTDTVDIEWFVYSDSVMYIKGFPASLLARNITDGNVANGITERDNKTESVHIRFYSVSPVGFLMNPDNVVYRFGYGGVMHEIQIAFLVNTEKSYGQYDSSSQKMDMQIVEAGVYVDGTLTPSMLSRETYFKFEGTKVAKEYLL